MVVRLCTVNRFIRRLELMNMVSVVTLCGTA